MGVTVECKKGNKSCDLGYFGFNRFRLKVAELHNKEFGEIFLSIINTDTYRMNKDEREKFYENIDNKIEELLKKKKINIKIVDFCLQSDCDGKIRYGACKNILKAIGDYDDDIRYGYSGRADCTMFKDLKELMQECVEKKCDMIWW